MRSFVKIKFSRNGEITLSFTDEDQSCHSRQFLGRKYVFKRYSRKLNSRENFRMYSTKAMISHSFNMYTQLPSGTRGLIIYMSLLLISFFVYVSSEGFDRTEVCTAC